MSLLKFAKIYMFKYLKFSVFIICFFFVSKSSLLSKEKNFNSNFLGSKHINLYEENLSSELHITTREKSPLLIQNTRPVKQQFNNKVFITLEGENANLLYAKELEEGSNLWLIDWINQPDFNKPLGGINKNSNNYKAIIKIKNSLGEIKKINLSIDVVNIEKKIETELTNLNSIILENKERFSNNEPHLTSELRIVTKEHSPLLLENQLPVKQEFNDKVLISIKGEDGDLFYAKEVEEKSNLWHIDWIRHPDFENPLGGINNNSNNYKALIKIKDSSENIKTIKLFVDVVDIDENLETALKKSYKDDNEMILNNSTRIPRKKKNLFSLDGLSLGFAEKGGYFGIAKDIREKNQFEIGYNYLDLDISRFFTTNSKVKIKNSSFKFALRRFFTKKINKEGFYLEGSGDLSKLDISSKYSLTNEDSSFGSLSVSCSACGNLYVNLEDKYNLIPSISLGYRRSITKRLNLDLKTGLQYINIPSFKWEAIQQDGTTYYPPFIFSRIENEANYEVEILNNKLESIPKILPTIGVNLIYKF